MALDAAEKHILFLSVPTTTNYPPENPGLCKAGRLAPVFVWGAEIGDMVLGDTVLGDTI